MTDPQTQGQLWQLQRKVDDLESKIARLERILLNVDQNAANAVNLIAKVDRKLR